MLKENVKNIIVKYLELNDMQYVLNISSEKANELGISIEDIKEASAELEQTNALIKNLLKEENPVSLSNPKSIETKLSGRIQTSGQEEGVGGGFAPLYSTHVRFNCISYVALTPVFTCRTYSFGNYRSETAVGLMGTVKTIDVPLVASNTEISVFFRTTDANGGIANWETIIL